MRNMFSFIFVILVVNPSFLSCSLTGPLCYFRMKNQNNPNGDKDIDCFFSIYTEQRNMKNDYFGGNLDKQSHIHIHQNDLTYYGTIVTDHNIIQWLTPKNIHLIFSLYFALDEINRNPHILPNISLLVNIQCNLVNYQIEPGISTERSETFPNYYCKNQRKYLIVLTGPMWRISATLGPYLYMSKTPELYYGHFQPLLSIREQLSYLCQISPRDISLPLAMVSLMVYFRWNWVGVIISDEDRGIQFLSELREEMQRKFVCLAFVSIITNDNLSYIKMAGTYYNQIMMSTAKVVIVYGDKDTKLQENIQYLKAAKVKRIWVSMSQFDRLTKEGDFFLDSTPGYLIYSHQNSEMPGLQKFMRTVHPTNYTNTLSLIRLWWNYYECSFSSSNCKKLKSCSKEDLLKWLFRFKFGMSMSDSSHNLYNAVYAVAHSLHEKLLQLEDTWSENAMKELELDPWQMFSFLKDVQFVNPAGESVIMNKKTKQDTEYDIFYITDVLSYFGFKSKIGKFSSNFPNDQQLYISEEMIEWATDFREILPSICTNPCSPGKRKLSHEGKAICCFVCKPCAENEISNMTNMDHCVKCPDDEYADHSKTHCLKKVVTFLAYEDPLGMSLAGLALFFFFLTVAIFAIFLKHQDSPIVKANNQILSYVLLTSLIFCFLCPLLYIGHPHKATCILQQTTFAIVFTMATSSVLAKTITVVLAFKVSMPDRRLRWLLSSGATNFLIPICTIIQLILFGIWMGTSPPFVEADVHTEHGFILIICNKGSIVAFHCVLGYLGSLALASFTVAFLARKLPDTFNEAKYLTFSMLVFCSVWITFLPVYQSAKGKAIVAVEVFCILASSSGLLLCIFAPKCYIILFKPQINSLDNVRKRHSKAETH